MPASCSRCAPRCWPSCAPSGAARSADLAFALEERESAELVAIDEALKRIADGSYGLCIDCGVGIATPRLHANPTALRCVACQEKIEHAQGTAPPAGY